MQLLARFSLWKLVGSTAFCFVLASLPYLPYMAGHLTYTAFYFQTGLGRGMLALSAAIALCFGGLYLAFLVEALFHPEAIWIDGDCLCWRRFGVKFVRISEIRAVSLQPFNIVRLELMPVSKSKDLPTGLCRKGDTPEQIFSDLQNLVAATTSENS